MDFLGWLCEKHNEQTGTANLEMLLQLRQAPSADTVQKFYEALTPEIRLEGREVELALRQLADMWIGNAFQFYDTARRVQALGPQGQTLADLDFDPGNMIPAMIPSMEGYVPQLDKDQPRDARAQHFLKLFAFHVTPNSLIALNAMEEQMKYFQLARAGLIDFWTLLEKMEISNVGSPPKMPLPPEQPIEQIMSTLGVVQGGDPMATMQTLGQAGYTIDPMSGDVMQMREPRTITERLMAQMQLGIGMEVNPAGRKASGQAPPKSETKSDGRTTVTESNK
jgi:hypothetical protein